MATEIERHVAEAAVDGDLIPRAWPLGRPPSPRPRWMHGASHRALLAFHHILSTKKIKTLHAWSHELELQGLLKVGYPGMLLVADRAPTSTRVPEYVRRIKRLPWQSCEVRAYGPVPLPTLDGLTHALHTLAVPASVSRRSGLVQLERMKDLSAFMQAADAAVPPPFDGTLSWAAFYRQAWRAA